MNVRSMIAGLVLLALMAACGSVPQPFRPPDGSKSHNEFLIAPESVGVTVRRIEGPVPWVGELLAEHMAEALRKGDVPASAKAGNRAAYVLSSQGFQQLHVDRGPELVLTWTLTAPDGRQLGQHTSRVTPPDAFWEAPEPPMFSLIAADAAPTVASWVLPRIGSGTVAGGAQNLASVAIGPIEGAPSDGPTALAGALATILRRDKVRVVEAPEPESVVVSAAVDLRPEGDSLETVSIVWRVADAEGREIGRVAQENQVEAGVLAERWGSIAYAAADGAAAGVKDLLVQLRDVRARAEPTAGATPRRR